MTCWIAALPLMAVLIVDAQEIRVALWGDMPTVGESENVFDPRDTAINGTSVGTLYANLRDSINAEPAPNFTLHAGDVKSGSQPCYDSVYFERFEQLANSIIAPVFLALGDNDWTDCHRDLARFRFTKPGNVLSAVRQRFYSKNGSPILGGGSIASWNTPVVTGGNDYPELQRFMYQDIMFIVVHVTGSNNNRYKTCFDWFSTSSWCPLTLFLSDFCCFGARSEYNARNEKVNEFLRESFQAAKDADAKGALVVGQAAIFDLVDFPTLFGDGPADFWDTLKTETLAFGNPVVYAHGDAHEYKLYIPDADDVPNFTAVMAPGGNWIGYVEISINSEALPIFSFTHIDLRPAS